MNFLVKILAVVVVVVTLVGAEGRHIENENDDSPNVEEQTELLNQIRDHTGQMRHRRRSRQSYYDYPPPFFYDNRRDYSSRMQEEYLSRILKSLDELIGLMRRNQAPEPKPVYISYPVIIRPCVSRPTQKPKPGNESDIPLFADRWPVMEDPNQNWGLGIDEVPEVEGDGSRPISFEPVPPNRPVSQTPPPVEHGSSQAGMEQTTKAPSRPGQCETAILTCCSVQDTAAQRNCFMRYGCSRTYSTKRACDADVINRVLDHFSQAYKPVV